MKKLGNTDAELKKSVAYKKGSNYFRNSVNTSRYSLNLLKQGRS